MSVASLAVESLTRQFAGAEQPAVDRVSFTVGAGEVLALVGASGSGKTTTLRMIAGYERPNAGRILLRDGRDVAREITAEPPQRRGFGMVFQHYALFPHMTVAENVGFGLEARGVTRRERLERARAALARVGLDAAGPRAVQSLSGGEQQRVALARAFVIDPPVLLLDEPLSNLDPARRQETREWLRLKLHELQSIAIFVTHDQEDAFAIADRMAVMRDGAILQIGAPEDLYHRPASVHVAEFVGRSTLASAEYDGAVARLTFGGVTQQAPVLSVPAPATPGSAFVAVVRPESLALVPYGDPTAWPGIVAVRRYAGGHYVYRVDVPSETSAAGERVEAFEIASDSGAFAERAPVGVRLLQRPLALIQR